MKKLILLTLCVSSLTLFSFFQQQPKIKKIDQDHWNIPQGAKFADADKMAMQDIIRKEYGIKDFSTVQTLEYKSSAKGIWILVNKHVGPSWVTEKIAGGKDSKMSSPSVKELSSILNKYAPSIARD